MKDLHCEIAEINASACLCDIIKMNKNGDIRRMYIQFIIGSVQYDVT